MGRFGECPRAGECGDRRAGFSLLELMVSLGIIATTILLVVGIFLSGVKVTQKGQDLSAGAQVAQSVLNEEFYKIQTGAGAVDSATFFREDTPDLVGQRSVGGTTFDYVIRHSLISDPVGDPIGERLPENRLKKMDVLVSWAPPGQSGAVGVGRLKVGMSKLVNQRSFR